MRDMKNPAAGGNRRTGFEAVMLAADGANPTNNACPGQLSVAIVVAKIAKGEGEVRVILDMFKGRNVIDVRLFELFTMAAVPMPTKRGVTLAVERLPELAAALMEAERQARELGLIGGDQ